MSSSTTSTAALLHSASSAPLPKLELKRLFKAPVARVFAAWTRPDELGRWIGPGNWKTTSAEIDLRVGGEYRIRMVHDGREIEMRGEYREIIAPTRLVFTWRQENDPEMDFGTTLVTVELTDVNGSTELHLTHEGFTDEEFREDHASGWEECFDAIERLITVNSPEAS